jgi:hypothetical protein
MPAAADILSDPIINQAYEDVRSDKSDTTWMVLKVSNVPPRFPSNYLYEIKLLWLKLVSMPPLRLTT